MSAASAPFGFVPTITDDDAHARDYPIAAAYATAIYKGMPVILNTDGTINAGTAAADLLGVFMGVEYVDGTGRPTVSNFWPTGGVSGATNVKAYVVDDPDQEFLVQADGSVAATAIGDQADVSNVGANGLGMSQATLSATLKGAGIQGQFRIMAFERSPFNAAGDAFTNVRVRIARHQYLAAKVAI
jgi:hypothetical protein